MSFLLYSDMQGKDCPHREPLANVQESCGKRKRSARLVLGVAVDWNKSTWTGSHMAPSYCT